MATLNFSNKEIMEKQKETIYSTNPATPFSWNGPKFDAGGLKILISYLLSENQLINTRIYRRINEYFVEAINYYAEQKDPVLNELSKIAIGALDSRLRLGLKDRVHIIVDMKNRQGIDFNDEEYKEVSGSEIEWIEEFASNVVDDMYMSKMLPQIASLKDLLASAAISERHSVIDRMYTLMAHMCSKHSEIKNDQEVANSIDIADDRNFDDALDEFIKTKTCETEKLKTGIRAVNAMLGGGFERKRVYAFMGIAGDGKSMTMLDLMLQVHDQNRFIVPKDPTKKPCIVMLTMENSNSETLERMLQMINGPVDWKTQSKESIKSSLRIAGMLPSPMSSNNEVEIKIVYRPGDSVDTTFLYELYDELAQQGYEMQALFMDYIARIRCVNGDNRDLIARLGSTTNEFKVFATAKDIPVITAAQINRAGAQLVSDRKSGRCAGSSRANLPYDLVTSITAEHIGDSHKLIENIDVAIALVPEYEGNNEANRKWLGLKVVKSRNATSENRVVFVPYDDFKKCKLIEDPLQGNCVTRWSMSSIYTENKGLNFNSNSPSAPASAYSNEGMDACKVVAEKPKQEATTFFNMNKKMDAKETEKSLASFFEEDDKIDIEAIRMHEQEEIERATFAPKPIRPIGSWDMYQQALAAQAANCYTRPVNPIGSWQMYQQAVMAQAANSYPQPQRQPISPFVPRNLYM